MAATRISRRGLLASAAGIGTLAVLPRKVTNANGPECVTLSVFPVQVGDRPHDVAPAATGMKVWYTAQGAGSLGLLDPLDGHIERIDLGKGSAPHGVIVGRDGAAWVTDGGRDEIQRVDAESFEITRHPIGRENANLNTAAFDGNGVLWFTGQNGVLGRFDPKQNIMTTADAPRGPGPYGICATPSGDVWFVSLAASYLGKLRFREGEIVVAEVDPPTPDAGTRRVWSDSSGRLWIAEWNAGQVGMYDPASKSWREWKLPGDAPQAYAIYVDDVDIVWLTDFGSNAIVRFDPEIEQFDVYPLPHAGGNVRQLLGRSSEVWGAESGADHLIVARTVCAGP
jgi:virginiamycin B lyase